MKKPIEESEVMDVLGNELPEINPLFEKISDTGNIYKVMDCFSAFTKQLIVKGNMADVKSCFLIAEKLLIKGNRIVKNAIENGYIFSISVFIDMASPVNEAVKKLITGPLKTEYNRQLRSSGI